MAETMAIQLEKPKYNLMSTPRYGPHIKKLRKLKKLAEEKKIKTGKSQTAKSTTKSAGR